MAAQEAAEVAALERQLRVLKARNLLLRAQLQQLNDELQNVANGAPGTSR